MPQVGWIDQNGEVFSLEEALEIARRTGFFDDTPEAVLKQMTETERSPYWISPSMAGGCIRQGFIKRETDYYLRLDDRWQASVGTGVHELAFKAHDDHEVIKEQRLQIELETIDQETLHLSGQIDRFDTRTGILVDYKTTKSFWRKEMPSYQHTLQQNLYVYLLRKHGYDPVRAFLWYAVPVTKRVQHPTLADQKITVFERKPVEIEIWEPGRTELILQELVGTVKDALAGSLPPPYQEGDDNYYLCGFCPVRAACMSHWIEELEVA